MRRSLPALAVASMLIAHGAALAQQPSTFIMLMNGDTLATESVTRTAGHLDAELVSQRLGMRVRYAATLAADGTMPRIDMWSYRAADTNGTHVTMQAQGDTMIVDLPGRTLRLPSRSGAIVYFNPSMALLEQAVLRGRTLGAIGSTEVPLFQSAGGAVTPLTVTWVGSDSAHLTLAGIAPRRSAHRKRSCQYFCFSAVVSASDSALATRW